MTGEERRESILKTIKETREPVSGGTLAKKFNVSRQVIVQDMALLRAKDHPIFSTTKGYYLGMGEKKVQRVFQVVHSDEAIEDELTTIVDLGGRILDVSVCHESYGTLCADLSISSRLQIRQFVENIKNGNSRPLKNLTNGTHSHRVEADSETILDLIEKTLKEKGYLR